MLLADYNTARVIVDVGRKLARKACNNVRGANRQGVISAFQPILNRLMNLLEIIPTRE